MSERSVLTPRSVDFPRWYQEVVARAELGENGPVRGTMVIRPYGFAIWERMQSEIDARIKAQGAENAYFPVLIPEALLRRESEHVEGFSPELAVVTHGGGKELEEPVVVRPTSETIINAHLARWIQSWRDLPVLLNQWANVVRWELRPRLFLRTSEFLWQEGHTAHATREEASAYALRILDQVYLDFFRKVLALPIVAGRKTARERFAGAIETWTAEALMGDGKALQAGTSHELGQNFSRAFDIRFSDEQGRESYVWQTSWGVSTRLVGALIMAHGDDHGLRVPPEVAPIQVVVMAVRADSEVAEAAARIAEELSALGVRVRLDGRAEPSFGRRSIDWELKGVPLRIELGPKDLVAGQAVLVRRDVRDKRPVALERLAVEVTEELRAMQERLYAEAADHLARATVESSTLAEAEEASRSGFAWLPAAELAGGGEERLAAGGVTVRCLCEPGGGIPRSSAEQADSELWALIARAY
jgi:prolyl-tRNA synthetase